MRTKGVHVWVTHTHTLCTKTVQHPASIKNKDNKGHANKGLTQPTRTHSKPGHSERSKAGGKIQCDTDT